MLERYSHPKSAAKYTAVEVAAEGISGQERKIDD
jgi:hypothetical protein